MVAHHCFLDDALSFSISCRSAFLGRSIASDTAYTEVAEIILKGLVRVYLMEGNAWRPPPHFGSLAS